MKIIVIDNYDSFTYNLVHYLEDLDCDVTVKRNDDLTLDFINDFDKILISPGPGIPDEAGLTKKIIKEFFDKKSILGVCLGHQAIGEVFGGKLHNLKDVFHGVSTEIEITSDDQLFINIPRKLKVGRYHSWIVKELSKDLVPLAFDRDKNVMALKLKNYNVWGVQFHPESILTEMGKEILKNWSYIKKNLIVISFMGLMTISMFNSVVYFALNYTQVINVALVLAAIPAVTIIISSFMKVDKTNVFQLIGLLLSVIGISSIISNADINKILALNFNKGDLWMLVCVICWSFYSTLLKKHSFKFSQFTLIQLMVSVGILFLIPQFFYEKSIGLETNFNIPFFIILFYVVMFPALAAYYCWQKGVEIVGPNRATMFIQLMPLLSAVLAIMIFQETFELYHFIGASFILSGIYLSNKKTTK